MITWWLKSHLFDYGQHWNAWTFHVYYVHACKIECKLSK